MNIWEEPDIFKNHRVIEASAGTGKTHTLVNLVLRLIETGEGTFDQILVVTFTEKAVGELRERILKELMEREKTGQGNKAIRDAIEHYDKASIHTIHGFCQRVLTQYAFENSQAGEAELINEKELNLLALKEIQRKEWPSWLDQNNTVLLDILGYPNNSGGESSWEKTVLEIVSKWNPAAGDILLPAGKNTIPSLVAGIEQELKNIAEKTMGIITQSGGKEKFLTDFSQMNTNRKKFNAAPIYNNIILPFFNWAENTSNSQGTELVSAFYYECYPVWSSYPRFNSEKPLIIPLDEEFNKDRNPESVLPIFHDLENLLIQCKTGFEFFCQASRAVFQAETIRLIRERSDYYRCINMKITFQDMLNRVWDSLQGEEKKNQLLHELRKTYRFALLDEFQDTDTIQWGIFKKIFSGKEEHKLFLIGDPKQSIYRFRGADVHTYYKAKTFLLKKNEGKLCDLKHNWRAHPHMLEGLNLFFDKGKWFEGHSELTYTRVSAPADNPRVGIGKDTTQRAPLTIVDLGDTHNSAKSASNQFSRFIADEIENLLGMQDGKQVTQPALTIRDNGCFRPLKANDICIQLRKRSEYQYLEKVLSGHKIPFSYYKQNGIWQCNEAMHLNYLLKAISKPNDKITIKAALLSDYFRLQPADLDDTINSPAKQAAETMLVNWAEIAVTRNWPGLFHKILSQSRIKQTYLSGDNGERRLTNITQLMQDLEKKAIGENLDIFELSSWLDKQYRKAITEGEEEYHRM
ncbi:MAG: UvrD-helicase domain-containing protein, partial [Fibrobacteria bacterium]|nr:UvrD-helicase domain-containing protein [Fibrobacteria bacterium]